MYDYHHREPEHLDWGIWECPSCGQVQSDPEHTVNTTCGNCHTMVVLCFIAGENEFHVELQGSE